MKYRYHYSHQFEIRVRYSETDQMGFCYYGNYLQFFEIGRVECLRSLGISYKKLEEQGIFLPVLEVSVKYLHPCFYDDLVAISTKIVEISGSRILFNYQIVNDNNKICSTGETSLAFLDAISKKPIRCPDEIIKHLEPYVE